MYFSTAGRFSNETCKKILLIIIFLIVKQIVIMISISRNYIVIKKVNRLFGPELLLLKYFHFSPKRLKAVGGFKTSKSKEIQKAAEKFRNIGITAHIDAGKTTTTERMLFYAGVIEFPGEVHHGDTVTDFLPQERERGITIQSAVVSFPWNGFSINLIDTPGHVDFTFEVERSLCVVDSAVAIIDASAGVEAQTLTVWRQAMENNLPRLIFLNKMDKVTASYQMCLESIKARLKSIPLLLQLPVYAKVPPQSGSGIIGIVDLVRMKKLIFDPSSKGVKYNAYCVKDDQEYLKTRHELVEQVSDYDSDLANRIIETESVESVTDDELESAIKRITLTNQIVPVFLGSAYKNVGVQPLLEAITTYLPHPTERPVKDKVISAYGPDLCSFVFKTLFDKRLGALTFLRVFKGTLKSADKIYNASQEKADKLLKLYQPLADDLREIDEIIPGQVAVVSGLKETFTGDTITSCSAAANAAKSKLVHLLNDETVKPVLTGVEVPEPVFFCSIEPASLVHQKSLESALEILQREDPSVRVHIDEDTGQTVLSGMGELHLEILHDRLKREYKVDADMGKLQIAYKETITEPITKRIVFERKFMDQKHCVTIELSLNPKEKTSKKVLQAKTSESMANLAHLRDKTFRCIQNGVESGFRFGPKLGFPIADVEVKLHWFEMAKFTSDTIVEAAAASCIRQALQDSRVVLLEPIVNLEIIVDANYASLVIDDLNRRRFQLHGLDEKHGNRVLFGTAPLGELVGYSTALRTVSSGLGSYSMQFSNYQRVVNSYEEQKIITQVRGF